MQDYCDTCAKSMQCASCGKALTIKNDRRQRHVNVEFNQRSGNDRRQHCRKEMCKILPHYTLIKAELQYCLGCWHSAEVKIDFENDSINLASCIV
jgi:hypothetical protein